MAEAAELQAKLQTYQQSLGQVEAALAQEPDNEQYKDLQKNLKEYIELTKDLLGIKPAQMPSVGSGHAAKPTGGKQVSVGQYVQAYYPDHSCYVNAIVTEASPGTGTCEVEYMGYKTKAVVQVSTLRPEKFPKPSELSAGTLCQGIFSEDGYWYNARIDSVQADGKYFVTYTDYGNSEALDIKHIRLATLEADSTEAGQAAQTKGSAEKKRKEPEVQVGQEFVIPDKLKILASDSEEIKQAKRKKVHALKSAFRQKQTEIEKDQKAKSWNSFTSKAKGAKAKGFLSATKKSSIFATTDDGRVGVTGSGKAMTNFAVMNVHSHSKAKVEHTLNAFQPNREEDD